MAFNAASEVENGVATITLDGELDATVAPQFKEAIEAVAVSEPKRLVLQMKGLSFMASAGLRVLIFAKQKMGEGVDIYVVSPQEPVLGTLEMSGFSKAVFITDTVPE